MQTLLFISFETDVDLNLSCLSFGFRNKVWVGFKLTCKADGHVIQKKKKSANVCLGVHSSFNVSRPVI